MLIFFFLSLLIQFKIQAHIVKDEVSVTGKLKFNFKTVCQKMVAHESPLIEIVSGTELNCMGKKVSVQDFCDKEMSADPYYIRAYVDRSNKEVICQSGKKVVFKYQCVKLADRQLCGADAEKSCLKIREKLARRLDLVHSSITKNEKKIMELNCLFESLPLNEKKNESL